MRGPRGRLRIPTRLLYGERDPLGVAAARGLERHGDDATVEFLPGRNKETKERMAKAIADVMVEIGGGSREHCCVIFRETSGDNWAIGGDLLSSEAFASKIAAYKERVKSG